jgi:hypothetical protein
MAEDLELRAKLRITEEGDDALKRAKGSLHETAEAAEEAQHHVGFLEHAMANFAAIELGEMVSRVRELGAEFLHAADEADAADQAVGALIATAQARDFADAHEEAGKLREELDNIAISAHQAGPAVADAFQTMLEITGATEKGVERASDQVEQLSQIATALGKNVGDISKEFSMMEEGVVRTKGQLFHVLSASGIFGDNTRKAAAGWAQLSEEERFRRLSYALEQMASKAKEAEPTFAQMRTTVTDIVEQMEEGVGRPLLAAINPEMRRFADELRSGIPVIEEFGKEMSVDVQRWVHEAADALQEGFDYVKAHGKEIHDDIVAAVETAKKVVEFIIDHKEAIALAFGAKTAIGLAGGLGKTAMEGPLGKGVELFVEGAKKVYAMGAAQGATGLLARTAVPGVSTVGNALAGGGALGGAAALGATGLAVGGLVAAGYQLTKLFEESSDDTRQTFDAVHAGMKDMAAENTEWTDVEVSAFERMRANLLESAQYLGEDVGAAAQFADALEKSHAAHAKNMQFAQSLEQMSRSFEVLALSAQMGVDSAKTAAEQAAAAKEQGAFEQGIGAQIVDQFSTGFEALMQAHDIGAQQYVAHLLGSSKNLFASFLQSAHMSDEGFLALANAVEAGGAEFKDQAQAIRDLVGNKEHQKMNVNFSMPGAKITIQQDFRDQDPDNVAVILKRDLVGAAVNRLGSGFSMPFGA